MTNLASGNSTAAASARDQALQVAGRMGRVGFLEVRVRAAGRSVQARYVRPAVAAAEEVAFYAGHVPHQADGAGFGT